MPWAICTICRIRKFPSSVSLSIFVQNSRGYISVTLGYVAVKLSDTFEIFHINRSIVSESGMSPTVCPQGGSNIHIAELCKIMWTALNGVKYQLRRLKFLQTVGSEPLYEIPV